MPATVHSGLLKDVPNWVPAGARHYLAHTELGRPIRALARDEGCHASTILRQVRRVEALRDDPLVDAALRALAVRQTRSVRKMSQLEGAKRLADQIQTPDDATVAREARRILRRLCESGAVLAVSQEMEKAVVVRDGPDHSGTRTAVVDRDVAQAMALKGWIQCNKPGRVSRYRITSEGRSALGALMAAAEMEARNLAEGNVDSDGQPATRKKCRPVRAEPPLMALARRREKDGSLFLSPGLVAAGERLREDFELAQTDPGQAQNWEAFLTGGVSTGAQTDGPLGGAYRARMRLQEALDVLGPGLGDVALRCCCFLDGLESIEKRMGWSQRSGKIVLRIALQRLLVHYEAKGEMNPLIG